MAHELVLQLWDAIGAGDATAVTCLVRSGADVHAEPYGDETALLHACALGRVDVVCALLGAGANVDVGSLHPYCGDDVRPILVAAQNGHVDIVRALLVAGAAWGVGRNGESPLRKAAARSHVNVVRFLLDPVNGFDWNGTHIAESLRAAIQFGAISTSQSRVYAQTEVAQCLVDAGAHVNHGESMLCTAVKERCVDVVGILLRAGASVCGVDRNFDDATYLATRFQPGGALHSMLRSYGALHFAIMLFYRVHIVMFYLMSSDQLPTKAVGAILMCLWREVLEARLKHRDEVDLLPSILAELSDERCLRLATAASYRSPHRALADCTSVHDVREKLCRIVFSPVTVSSRFRKSA